MTEAGTGTIVSPVPVFCTAACLLILSVNNDVEQLMSMGKHQ